MQVQEIKSRILKLDQIRWRELDFIQDDNFKEWIDGGNEKLINSLIKYQFADPFKVWENKGTIYCLDGKHRYLDLAHLETLGVEIPDTLPATFIDCESKEEAAELVLVYSSAYAKITQQGLFDFVQKFNLDVPTLRDQISIPDFSMERFEQKFNLFDVESAEEDEVYVLDKDVIVSEGDIFQLNNHRILCGSFKDSERVAELMQGEKARIVNCDPPYNLPANFFSNNSTKRHKDFAEGAGEMSDQEFMEFLASIMQVSVDNTVPGAIHYIFMDFRHSWHMTEAARRIYGNPQPKQVCVWAKDLIANGSFYRAQQELCFIFSDEKSKALWNKDLIDEGGEFYKDNNEWCYIFKNGDGAKHLSHLELKDRIRSNVWKYPSSISRSNPDRFELKNHPTPKPVVMIADSILDTTNQGDIVIDWFLGSGTTLIASEHTGRKGGFTEVEPVYVQGDIIRYINYCEKRGINVNFEHLNGDLTLNDFLNERDKLSKPDSNER
ncbi:DNA-methyltransferase [Chryseobacterium sp. R2A-55]|uniref:DNA-methyltransferase n=1 Tax=Chryseobacterium sp. R2A-55 TaxID=2744445 RepID=UPI001F1E7834|nr:site-specific DNA-methyltransferase [Chryseobacterium sp. R2A-55]